MGGYSSGRHGWRPHLEDALRFDLTRFKECQDELTNVWFMGSWQWSRYGKKYAGVGYNWRTSDWAGELVFRWSQNGKSYENRIKLEALPLNFGGKRWWMRCPASGKRARVLYLFPGLDTFVHRTAIQPLPTYSIQRQSGASKIINQRWKIRQKIGDEFSDLFTPLWKPKGMHRRRFWKYQKRDMDLWDQERVFLGKFLDYTDEF